MLKERKELTLQYMIRLNDLLQADNFSERFYDNGTATVGNTECPVLKMDNPSDSSKSIKLCVTYDAGLTFLNNFYDADDLDLNDNDFENNLKKIYALLKPIINNEIFSVGGLCNGRGFGSIFTLKRASCFYLDKHYSDLVFKIWNGEINRELIETMTTEGKKYEETYISANKQRKGTCCYEFRAGKVKHKRWRDGSISISGGEDSDAVIKIFSCFIIGFAPKGITHLDREKGEAFIESLRELRAVGWRDGIVRSFRKNGRTQSYGRKRRKKIKQTVFFAARQCFCV